ncbi:hypothetical protein CRENPOLYSF2_3010001 [Crenothrix polyspora]|uniref:Uncharacterized protein n=1 Tax=Crenothrix polyspora TaxID=360316 RepID=A0A1R4H9S1_9GAMM|nr:hypothetical protein CRENPOLYSF2_3010001 [Crenothrix polyspora]
MQVWLNEKTTLQTHSDNKNRLGFISSIIQHQPFSRFNCE